MWTSVLDSSPRRTALTHWLGRFWRGAYFASFAPLQVQNLPRQPLPATNWVRVRNRLSGICGCDLHLIYGESDVRTAPAAVPTRHRLYPGHEVVGEVIEVGNDVQYLSVGDRVVLQYGPNCLMAGVQPLCRSCANGNYALCERGDLPGPYPIGGGWSEEMLLHEQQLFTILPSISDEQAVLLEPAAVAFHAVLRHTPHPTDRVLIIGAGTIGLLTLLVLHTLVPRAEVSVLARHPFQVEQATRLGATHIIYPQDSYAEVQRVTGAQLYRGVAGNKMLLGGYDVVFDTIGDQQTLYDALRWTRANGAVVLAGLKPLIMRMDLTPIWYREVKLIGAVGHGTEQWPLGSSNQQPTFSIVAELMDRGLLHPERLITHRFALSDYRHALSAATEKELSRAIKVVFDYSLQPASVVPNVRTARSRRTAPVEHGPNSASGRATRSVGALPTTPPITPLPPDEPEPEEATTTEPPTEPDASDQPSSIVENDSEHQTLSVATNEVTSAFPHVESTSATVHLP
jgi:2-desacetyl-2-hydroxyethyl bacteriochlorophyllide A dehydrogenase